LRPLLISASRNAPSTICAGWALAQGSANTVGAFITTSMNSRNGRLTAAATQRRSIDHGQYIELPLACFDYHCAIVCHCCGSGNLAHSAPLFDLERLKKCAHWLVFGRASATQTP